MRKSIRQTQLEWHRPDEVRWADLPAEVRDRVREALARLLRERARRGQPPPEARHEP